MGIFRTLYLQKFSNKFKYILFLAKNIRPKKEIGIVFAFIAVALSIFLYEYETQQSSKNWEKYQETHVPFDDALEEIIFKERELFYGQKNRITKLDQELASLEDRIKDLNIALNEEKVRNNDHRLEIVRLNQALETTTRISTQKDGEIAQLQSALRNRKITIDKLEAKNDQEEDKKLAAIESNKSIILPSNPKIKTLNLNKPDVDTTESVAEQFITEDAEAAVDEKKLDTNIRITDPEISTHDDVDRGKETIIFVAIGETLSSILQKIDVSEDEAKAIVASLKKIYDPRKLKSGQKIAFKFDHTGDPAKPLNLQQVSWQIDSARSVIIVKKSQKSFLAKIETLKLDQELVVRSGIIKSSLYDAAMKKDVPIIALYEMVDAFAYDVDFQRDIKRNDEFKILYNVSHTPAGKPLRAEVLYGSLTLGNNVMEIYRYENGDDIPGFYDRNGESVERALMKTPINGARLSSRYGMRKHPILGYSKMHRGVDFAARKGTPIKAAGSGTVVSIGRNGSYGNYIELKHSSVYKTAYAHLHKFARGLKKGSKVRQAQTIGYVGSTGRSTGPHLHFEILKFGQRVNPMNVNLPTGKKLEASELADFRNKIIEID